VKRDIDTGMLVAGQQGSSPADGQAFTRSSDPSAPPSPESAPSRSNEAARELCELRSRVAQLEHELTVRDEFISAIGHELRNPISPVLLHMQRLEDRAQQAPNGQLPSAWLSEQFRTFNLRLEKFLKVLDRVLDASRIGDGRLDLVLEPVDLADVARDVAAIFEKELGAAHSVLHLELDEGVTGHWDRMRLEQILSNLLSNAIRYGAGSEIQVHVGREGELARLRVRDHGQGIASEDRLRIFERFVRVGATQKRGGFGIGLWIVKEICTALGGSVDVESQLGAGSEFTVTLPRQPPRAPEGTLGLDSGAIHE
jgi:signal transduction histidine kinase